MKTDHGCLKAVLQLARALSEVHDKGVIHNDLKFNNITVQYEDNNIWPIVSIIDYGLAWFDDMQYPSQLKVCQNDFPWMAPELFAEGGGICSTKSDMYSLGIIVDNILVNCLKGSYPDLNTIVRQALADDPVSRPTLYRFIKTVQKVVERTDPHTTLWRRPPTTTTRPPTGTARPTTAIARPHHLPSSSGIRLGKR
ncbi:hypothetical protein OTU49_015677 [Cherax quadricarinatus]|uniref:Protein kinase domain-containing protein n=1 Tax=Cherax quadricarinatus TaxID=27406 RepID=A0AAW0Y8D9_CHEQU